MGRYDRPACQLWLRGSIGSRPSSWGGRPPGDIPPCEPGRKKEVCWKSFVLFIHCSSPFYPLLTIVLLLSQIFLKARQMARCFLSVFS